MVAIRKPRHEITTTAARAVSSGHLHLAPDGRCGVYLGAQDVAIGETLVLHMDEHLKLDADDAAATSAGDLCNFDLATQLIVASGATNIGRYTADKALNATTAEVLLNAVLPSADPA